MSGADIMEDSDNSSESYVGPSPADFHSAARDIQNCRRVGSATVVRRAFKEYFGIHSTIVCLVWKLLINKDLLLKKTQIKHLLWALFFMKVSPKQGPACSVARLLITG